MSQLPVHTHFNHDPCDLEHRHCTCPSKARRYAPVIRDYYQHLQQQGKAKKVALVACMRKLLIRLNALMAEPQNA